jgi:large subunit ribosomal protein L24
MRKKWSRHWIRSIQPRKQRKYVHNAPLHIIHKIFASMLSKELKKKYGKNSLTLRKGDKIKILRGQFKDKTGKVEKVSLSKRKVYIEGIYILKKDGKRSQYAIHPSNLMIMELNLEDKKRIKILDRK